MGVNRLGLVGDPARLDDSHDWTTVENTIAGGAHNEVLIRSTQRKSNDYDQTPELGRRTQLRTARATP